jgi:hypothetical protein
MVQLYDVISNGYNKDKNKLNGYELDKNLSNHNNQVYVNKKDKKFIYNTTGTHSLSDIGTDILLGLGGLKKTKRYQEAHKGIRDTKQKYSGYNGTVTGDSLGGAIARNISSKGDKVVTYNTASTLGESSKLRENNYRIKWDPISSLIKGTKTLKNNIKVPTFLGGLYDSHVPKALKGHNIKL